MSVGTYERVPTNHSHLTSSPPRTPEYLAHTIAAARAENYALGVKLVGVDTLSPDETRVDGTMPDFGVHAAVLGAGMIIAENLTNLKAIQDGDWLVTLVPLKLGGSDGSPVRAFATEAGAHR